MRKIEFRGKRIDNNQWVYGYLSESNCINVEVRDDSVGYSTIDDYEIKPDTVGQFTGLYDKNGKEIYEGDIVFIHNYTAYFKNGEPDFDYRIFEVKYNKYTWAFNNDAVYMPLSNYDSNTLEDYEIEIIGNIYEGASNDNK